MTGIIGRHVAIATWVNSTHVENVGEVVACELQNGHGHFALLVARDDGSLTAVLEEDAFIINANEFKRLIRNERRRRRSK